MKLAGAAGGLISLPVAALLFRLRGHYFAIGSWVVAEVTGTANMFPALTPTEFPPLDATVIIKALSVGLDLSTLPLTSKLRPSHTHIQTPYAITNPIWIDVDGDGWTPPKPPLSRKPAAAAPPPDVRARFDALPEVSR